MIVRAYHLLEEGAGDAPAAQTCYVQDLAVAVRALLALYEHPGPLGPPTGRDEIEGVFPSDRGRGAVRAGDVRE